MTPEIKAMILKLMSQMEQVTAPAKRLIIPVSGGSDSALIFTLLSEMAPEKTVGIYIGNNLREREWFEVMGHLEVLDLDPVIANSEPYRWAALLSYTLKQNGWLLGSRTRTEQILGTYSLASRVATYLPLVHIWKTDVMRMCEALGVPKAITDSSRQADPDCGRPQEMAEIPLETIDKYLKYEVGESLDIKLPTAQWDYLDNIVRYNKFKKSLPLTHGDSL